MGAMVLTANAQKTVQGSGFYDNGSAGVVAGGITPTTHSAFFKNMRATYGVELTKQITPVFALGAQFMAANNVSESATVFDASNLSLLGKFMFPTPSGATRENRASSKWKPLSAQDGDVIIITPQPVQVSTT